jgi:hypothetical protein
MLLYWILQAVIGLVYVAMKKLPIINSIHKYSNLTEKYEYKNITIKEGD